MRLTESDLNRIVRKIIRLNEEEEFDIYASTPHANMGYYLDSKNKRHSNIEYDESKTFGPDEYDDFMEYINNCDTNWCIKTKEWYGRYTKGGPLVVGKKRR